MPHVEARYCQSTAIVVTVNDTPVSFKRMGNPDLTLSVRMAIFLAISDETKQVPFLSRLSNIFSDGTFSRLINSTDGPEAVAQYLRTVLAQERGESYA